jgi:hypothetical protein
MTFSEEPLWVRRSLHRSFPYLVEFFPAAPLGVSRVSFS